MNHEKVRLISKTQTQMYWVMIVNDSLRYNQYFIEQQIPKCLSNHLFENKLKQLKNEQDFFRKVTALGGFQDYFFSTEGIINDEQQEDIWSIYKVTGEFDCYQSLDQLLYRVSFDASQSKKQYDVDHGEFYTML